MSINDRAQLINNGQMGGDIVAIYMQQAIRTMAVSASMVSQASREVALEGGVDGSPNYIPPALFVAGVPVTVRTQETYSYDAEITETAIEDAAIISDHIILHPIKIDLSFELSNWTPGQAAYSLDLLETMWKSRVRLDLQTEHKKIKNMVLEKLSVVNSAPVWGRLEFKATFKQVSDASLPTITMTASQVQHQPEKTSGPEVTKSAEPPVQNGQQVKGEMSDSEIDAEIKQLDNYKAGMKDGSIPLYKRGGK